MAIKKYLQTVKYCRICNSSDIHPFLDLGKVALPNAFLKDSQLNLSEPLFPLIAGFCQKCRLVQLMHIVDPEIMFKNYVYIPSASKTRLNNFKQIVDGVTEILSPKKNLLAVDIGSNDGSLLQEFKKIGVKTLGVDPAENLAKVSQLKGIEVYIGYFNFKTAKKIKSKFGSASYITATNVLAHIDDLHGVFRGARELLAKNGIFVCEFPYLVDLLEKKLFDTIYHEHLSYFAIYPLRKIVDKCGLKIIDVRRTLIDGGALRVSIARKDSDYPENSNSIKELTDLEDKLGLDIFETYKKFAGQVYKLKDDIRNLIFKLKKQNKSIAGYGASARGNILLSYSGIGNKQIDFIVDSTSYKQGLFTPGHHIPIYPEEELLNKKPDYTILLAWNFADEIVKKQSEYERLGGRFILPVPGVRIFEPVRNKAIKRQKVVVVMPALNAAKTVEAAYRKLPKDLIDEVILVDDDSQDDTLDKARKLPIKAYRNESNLGYGGNLKVCLSKALEVGADIIIEYHPDDQYDPKDLRLFIEKSREGFDFALGSRFIFPKTAIENKMPLSKFIANRAMSFMDELVLGIEMSEFHSGFRMYTRKLLESVPFRQNSDDYLFSFEIIVQAVYWGFKVAEVPVSCRYHPAMHTADFRRSAIYALGTFKTLWQYLMAKFLRYQRGPFLKIQPAPCPKCGQKLTRFEGVVKDGVSREQFSVFFCTICQNGFTVPAPKDLSRYYPKTYYSPVKSLIYNLLQFRRPDIIRQYKKSGKLLDIGCGDGSISSLLSEFSYTGVETSFSGAKKNNILIGGVEKVEISSATFDIVTFWESLEHVSSPASALAKVFKSLKKNGVLIIECPNYASSERLIFGSKWFHLDAPRHLTHFTPKGLSRLLEEVGFEVVDQRQLYAPEYTPVGLAQSIMYLISPQLNFVALTSNGLLPAILISAILFSLLIFTFPLSIVLYWMKASPILLTVAKKTLKH